MIKKRRVRTRSPRGHRPWDQRGIRARPLSERGLETAAGFAARGLEPGDVVAPMMPNRVVHGEYTGAIDALLHLLTQ